MSAQHHRRTFRQWLADPFGRRETPKPTGWTRHKPVTYPVPAKATMASGHGYRMVQATGALLPVTIMQQAIPQGELSIEQLNRIASRLSPEGIAQLPTIKDLKTDQLPAHVLQQMANAGRLADNQQIAARARQMQALKHQPTTQIVPMQMPQLPEPICTPLKPEQLPSWLLEEPPIARNPSGFLLSREVVLEEDPEATMQREAIKIKKKKESE